MSESERERDGPGDEDAVPGDEHGAEDGAGGDLSAEGDDFARAVAEAERELPALPPPPKWQRQLTLAVMAVTTIVCGLVAWQLKGDVLYALRAPEPLELGDLRAADLGQRHDNRYVRGYAHLEPAPVVEYERVAERDRYRLLPVAGAPQLWVEHRVPSGLDGPRFSAPSRVAGRLVRLDELGLRRRGVAAAVARGQRSVSAEPAQWVLLQGEDPPSQRWVLALAVLLVGFALWNVWGMLRVARRVEPV